MITPAQRPRIGRSRAFPTEPRAILPIGSLPPRHHRDHLVPPSASGNNCPWISPGYVSAQPVHAGERRERVRLGDRGGHNVEHVPAAREQRVGDDRPVAPPRHRLGAHMIAVGVRRRQRPSARRARRRTSAWRGSRRTRGSPRCAQPALGLSFAGRRRPPRSRNGAYASPKPGRLAASASSAKCGYRRDFGMSRTSAIVRMLCAFRLLTNSSSVRVEWPTVKIVGVVAGMAGTCKGVNSHHGIACRTLGEARRHGGETTAERLRESKPPSCVIHLKDRRTSFTGVRNSTSIIFSLAFSVSP